MIAVQKKIGAVAVDDVKTNDVWDVGWGNRAMSPCSDDLS